jgi:hypothetical protein
MPGFAPVWSQSLPVEDYQILDQLSQYEFPDGLEWAVRNPPAANITRKISDGAILRCRRPRNRKRRKFAIRRRFRRY